MTIIHEVPGMADKHGMGLITADGIVKNFVAESKTVRTEAELADFVTKWNAIWRLDRPQKSAKPSAVAEVDAKIATGNFDKKVALACFARVRGGQPCAHATPWGLRPKPRTKRLRKKALKKGGGGLCPGMEIRLPWAITMTVLTANHYGAPEGTALHQLFCPGPHHSCF